MIFMLPVCKYSWVVLEHNGRNQRWAPEASVSVLLHTGYWEAAVILPTQLWGGAKVNFTLAGIL